MKIARILLCCLAGCLLFAGIAAAADYRLGEKNWKVAVAQRNLVAAGYPVDRQDGVLTAQTVAALKHFQAQAKLPANGKLDNKTYQTLAEEAYRKQAPLGVKGRDVVAAAAALHGARYRYGGTAPDKGFDCSGYVSYVFAKHKVALPRTADRQYERGLYVLRQALRAGDLVFFTTSEPGPSHVGIYAANGAFWHASSSRGVMLSRLDDPYWKPRYLGARRILLE